jgi:translocation and assembly module TamB
MLSCDLECIRTNTGGCMEAWTMARKIRTRVIEEFETDGAADDGAPRPGRSRLVRRVLIGGLLLAALAWFAPLIAGATGLWKSLLASAAPELAGKIDAKSLSLSWLSPIVARQVRLRDANGQPLAEVESVRTQRSLLELVLYRDDAGQVLLTKPHLLLVLRADGSNLEDFLSSLAKRSSASSSPLGFSLQIAEGSVDVDDTISGRPWGLADVSGDFQWPAAEDKPKTGKITAAVLAPGNEPEAPTDRGELLAEISWQPGKTAEDALGSGAIDAALTSVPSQAVEGIIRRFALDLRPYGPVSAEGGYEWAGSFASQKITLKQAASPALSLAAPLTAEQPVQTRVQNLSGVVEISAGRITASDLVLDSDVARLSGSGSLSLASYSLEGLLAAIQSPRPDESVALQGSIDLALIAEQLRQPLRLRDDTRITEGVLELALGSKIFAGERGWEATLRVNRLAAQAAGRSVAWEEPVQVNCVLHQSPQGLKIRELSAEASFAKLNGSGTLADGELTAEADLDQLRQELSQFADVGSGELAGRLSGKVRWQQGEQDAWTGRAEADVTEFQLAFPGMLPWRESDLQIAAEAAGILRGPFLSRLDAARLTIGSGGDKLDVELSQPLAMPSLSSAWPLSYTLVGRMETWLPRMQTWLPLAGWDVSGGIDLAGDGAFSPERVALSGVKLNLANLSARRFAHVGTQRVALLSISEPQVKIETTATFDRQRMTLVSPSTTLASSALAFRADDVNVEMGSKLSLSGLVDFRGDLARLSGWLGDDKSRTWLLGGMMVGRIEAVIHEGVVQGSVATDVENLSFLTRAISPQPTGVTPVASGTPGWVMDWVEPKVGLSGEGTYDPASDKLSLKQAKFDATNVSLATAGTIDQLSRSCQLNLAGNVACDMASVAQKLRPILGDTLTMTGSQRRDFELRGPLFGLAAGPPAATNDAAGLTGQAGIGWQQAQFLGLTAGPANIDAHLAKGIVSVDPVNIDVSEGRLLAAPSVYLYEPQLPLVMGKGPVVEKVRISPELCRGWLKYVAPLLADATRAEGKFSVDLEGGTVPLLQPEKMDVGGILSIHEAQIGPGPLAMTYLNLAMQVKAILAGKPGQPDSIDPNKGWILLPEQQVEMRALAGRVHHRGLTMHVKDVVIRTEGSVGFDQKLELVAAIPVQDKWIEKEKLPAFLKGQTIYVPIRGQINKPEPDARVLGELAKQLLVGGAQNLLKEKLETGRGRIEQELQKGLDRLFQPKPPK